MRVFDPARGVSIVALAIAFAVLAPAGALAEAVHAPCGSPPSTLDPTTTAGEGHAVAITAQTLEAGVPGWADVTWEAVAGHSIGAVSAAGVDAEVLTSDATGGRATGTTSLTICTTTGAGS